MTTSILDIYGRKFGEQETRESRGIEKSQTAVNEICRKYEEFEILSRINSLRDWGKLYDQANEVLCKNRYSATDIGVFSVRFAKYQKIPDFTHDGLFLSALINSSPDTDFEVFFLDFDNPLNVFGRRNRKNIVVHGNIGTDLGSFMESGRIEVYGNSSTCTAAKMKNGEIIIHGDVGVFLGDYMKDGIVRVDGKILSIAPTRSGGQIYEGGKLVRG